MRSSGITPRCAGSRGALLGSTCFLRGEWGRLGGAEAEANAQASLDQTTRIHAGIPVTGGDALPSVIWHEVGRPQVHGYDLVGVASLDALRFVSIADEKVARVFEAPREFIQVLDNLGIASLAPDSVEVNCFFQWASHILNDCR